MAEEQKHEEAEAEAQEAQESDPPSASLGVPVLNYGGRGGGDGITLSCDVLSADEDLSFAETTSSKGSSHRFNDSPEATAARHQKQKQQQQQLQKEQEFVKMETFRVNVSKFIVVLAIIASGTVCSVMTHKVVTRSELNDYYDALETFQGEIEDVSQNAALRAFTAIGSLSKSITASAVIANEGNNNNNSSNNSSLFPFYSMPFFHVQAGETQHNSGADAIIYAPLVHKSQQAEWERYAIEHQKWIRRGLAYRGVDVANNDPGLIPTQVFSYRTDEETEMDFSLTHDDHQPGEVHIQDYILPIWQMAGAPINASIVNMDLLTASSFEHTMVDALINRHGILSEIDDFSFLTVYSTAMTTQEELAKNHKDNDDKNDDPEFVPPPHPQSYMLEPVYESFEDDAPIVGFVIAIFPWDTYFLNVLPKGIDIILVIKDRCGHTETWEINGPEVSYQGEGDLSRMNHKHQMLSVEFATFARYNHPEGEHPVEYIYGLQEEEEEERLGQDGTPSATSTTATSPPSAFETSGGRKQRTKRQLQEGTSTMSPTNWSLSSSSAYVDKFGATYDDKFQDMDHSSHCAYVIELHPTVWLEIAYESDRPKLYALGIGMIFGVILLLLLAFDGMVVRRQRKLMTAARRTHAVVASLFPETVQQRILDDALHSTSHNGADKNELRKSSSPFTNVSRNSGQGGISRGVGVGEGDDGAFVYGSKPIADFFPSTSIMFADLAGFTAWSSQREPTQVFQLLEKIYCSFDELARARGVFKVETIGDCYMAACGLPDKRDDHAVVMASFARDCLHRYPRILREMGKYLGAEVRELGLRTGIHSGPVTAGVLRGEKSRFQLFGDTVNTCSRMESTGVKNRIQISHQTMELLLASGMDDWVQKRETTVTAKGKGELQTYWLLSRSEQAALLAVGSNNRAGEEEEEEPTEQSYK